MAMKLEEAFRICSEFFDDYDNGFGKSCRHANTMELLIATQTLARKHVENVRAIEGILGMNSGPAKIESPYLQDDGTYLAKD